MSAVITLLENYSIHVILSLRGAEQGFHWGIFCTYGQAYWRRVVCR